MRAISAHSHRWGARFHVKQERDLPGWIPLLAKRRVSAAAGGQFEEPLAERAEIPAGGLRGHREK
ncbi:hypothetical protein Misp02_51140 [Microtetraspora sp. NBRC 16547]|nr:hypothetical protein Misp02_51140 [Microtetraspora sp. NBRC 16547]